MDLSGDVPEWLMAVIANHLFVGSIPTVTSKFEGPAQLLSGAFCFSNNNNLAVSRFRIHSTIIIQNHAE